MQNQLKRHLPASFTSLFPPNQNLAYAAVAAIPTLPPAQRIIVTKVFADALQVVWRILISVPVAGLVSCLWMQEIPMSKDVDARFALDTEATDLASSDGDMEMGRKAEQVEDDRAHPKTSPSLVLATR
jgi:hypothetical protein